MNFEAFRQSIESLSHGKKLPGATYLFRPDERDVPAEFWKTISRAELAAQPAPSWNLLKIQQAAASEVLGSTHPDWNKGQPGNRMELLDFEILALGAREMSRHARERRGRVGSAMAFCQAVCQT